MLKFISLATFILIASETSAASPWRSVISEKLCSDLLAESRKDAVVTRATYLNWVQGYFSGENSVLMLRDEIYHVVPNDAIVWQRIMDTCRGAPTLTIGQMASDYLGSLHKRSVER